MLLTGGRSHVIVWWISRYGVVDLTLWCGGPHAMVLTGGGSHVIVWWISRYGTNGRRISRYGVVDLTLWY